MTWRCGVLAAALFTYVWHYVVTRLLYDGLIRGGGLVALVLVAGVVAAAAFVLFRKREP